MVCSEVQCFLTEKKLKAIYTTGVLLLGVLFLADLYTQKIDTGVFVLAFIYSLLGGLMVFKKVSIVCCPAKVLIVGVVYISAMAVLNTFMF